ncbi:putative glycolipid-binding domain-containing protein [Actinotalea sp. Marseille-Q4924]|uniref:putative glycolipid-binding domain-containing protein n=1 Tax=Actinotalea sp. Marseille-Q4924 TaxID=2866571 RepID=UPI001CE3F34C|nr:putative glycolipid-binding domain-containing protein [Actinotalea sp. Marseille-Q4924]
MTSRGEPEDGHRGRRRLVTWRGSEPHRVDVAVVTLHADRLTAHGTSTGDAHLLRYRLATDHDWQTTRLEVVVEASGTRRELDLRRDASGRWSARRTVYEPGDWWFEDLELDELDGAADVGLALCPLTSTMPVLRGGFLDASRRGHELERTLTAAWVDVPHLTVEPSTQVLRSLTATEDGAARVLHLGDGFEAQLVLDDDGLVVGHPDAVRIDG